MPFDLVESLDHQELLSSAGPPTAAEPSDADELDDDTLLAELGIEVEAPPHHRAASHVRSTAEKKAGRKHCEPREVMQGL